MDPLSIAASVAGLLSLTVQVSQVLYEQVHTLKNAVKGAQELLDELDSLRAVLTKLETFLREQALKGHMFASTSVLISSIKGCDDKLSTVKSRLERLVQRRGLTQMIERGKWYFEHDEHQEIMTSFHRYLSIFQISLSLDGIDLLSKSVEDVAREVGGLKSAICALTPDPEEAKAKSKQFDDILQLLHPLSTVSQDVMEISSAMQRWDLKWQDQKSQEILAWLSPLNFWPKQMDTFSRKQKGTGQWLFEEHAFKEWLDGKEKTLLCLGMPGAGKTILASMVIDHVEGNFCKEDTFMAFIYCNYKEHSDHTTTNLIASILQQLVQRRPTIPKKIRALYDQHAAKKTRPSIAECSELVQLELAACSKAFIIVDALDECKEGNGTRSNLIAEFRNLPPNTSLLITSRHISSIENELSEARRLEIRASDADVKIYLDDRIKKESRLKLHIQVDPTLRNTIIDTIIGKVQGMFLLAQLHIESLAKKRTRKDLRIALKDLPKGLDETYDKTMERICSQDEDDAELAKKVLCWISYAFRPLTVEELQYAVAIEPGDKAIDEEALPDKTLLTSLCAGLVTIDDGEGIIRLIHYTTQEYFERRRLEIFPDGQTSITSTCLIYLSFDALDVGYYSDKKEKNLLSQYAGQYWGRHAIGKSEEILKSQILEFLANDAKVCCSVKTGLFHDLEILSQYDFKNQLLGIPNRIPGLIAAAIFGLEKSGRSLIDQNIDINTQTQNGLTVLMIAALRGHESFVLLLLDKGASVNVKTQEEVTALHLAVKSRQKAVTKLLLEKGANIEAKTFSEHTPLHLAAESGHEAVVQLLLEKGANIEAKTSIERTPLHFAAESGHEAVTQLLLEKGANIEAKAFSEHTPLHLAAENGHEAVVILQLLLEKGANIEAKTYGERTPLHLTAESGHKAVTQLLLEKGANIEAKTSIERTPLHFAAENGHEAVVQLLLEKGANIEAKTSGERTPLHFAMKSGHEAIVQLLLEKGANVDDRNGEGKGALHFAARYGHDKIIQMLIENGVNVDITNMEGNTALHIAAQNSFVEIVWRYDHVGAVRVLLERGANVNVKNHRGETALDIAKLRGLEHIVQLLLQNEAPSIVELEGLSDREA